jgi:amino acid permease
MDKNEVDIKVVDAPHASDPDNGLKRVLKSRHLQMLAIGEYRAGCKTANPKAVSSAPATLLAVSLRSGGTSPDMTVGSGFTNGGPAGLLLGFGIVGIMLWTVMQSLGEMASFLAVSGMWRPLPSALKLHPGSFTNYTSRFLDPAIGFSLGWNYAFLWFGILAAEYNNLGLGTPHRQSRQLLTYSNDLLAVGDAKLGFYPYFLGCLLGV